MSDNADKTKKLKKDIEALKEKIRLIKEEMNDTTRKFSSLLNT